MKVSVLSIGNELLSGFTLNTNATWIGQELLKCGITIDRQITVGDNSGQIIKELDRRIQSSEVILLTGGLGPTHDDVTSIALYEYFEDNPTFDSDYWENIEKYFTKRDLSIPEINKNQALKSVKGKMIPNLLGSARGLHYKINKTEIFAMPGVPEEMKSMMSEYIIPKLKSRVNNNLFIITLNTIGRGESSIAEQLEPIITPYLKFCSVSYLPKISGVDIRITSRDKKRLYELKDKIKHEIVNYLYSEKNEAIENILGALLSKKMMTLAVAESCTGGLLGHTISSVSGSSEYFIGGIISYSNKIKRDILGVKEKTLTKFGAVSKQTAIEMAQKIRKLFLTDIGISVTGIAGPTGGNSEKPVGLVYIGLSSVDKKFAKKYMFHGDRDLITRRSNQAAMELVRREILGD